MNESGPRGEPQARLQPRKSAPRTATPARPSRRSAVRRMLLPRLLGLNLGAVAVGAALIDEDASAWIWPLLAFNALAWPFLAFLLARRSRDPEHSERVSLVVDSAMGGFWIAQMHFNPAPSLLLVLTLSMDKLAFGGWRFLLLTASAQSIACALTAATTGLRADLHSSTPVLLACIPHLLIYPMLVAHTAHRLLRVIEKQRQRLATESRRDALTGLYNRAFWEEMAEHEFQRFRRSANPSSIVVIDVDGFKSINDRLGHAVGDAVIQAVARAIAGATRASDTAARFGGDEFVLLLSDSVQAEALRNAERICEVLRALRVKEAGDTRLSASIGVAAVDVGTADVAAWFHRADLALYEAKRLGRDRVVAAPVSEPSRLRSAARPQQELRVMAG